MGVNELGRVDGRSEGHIETGIIVGDPELLNVGESELEWCVGAFVALCVGERLVGR